MSVRRATRVIAASALLLPAAGLLLATPATAADSDITSNPSGSSFTGTPTSIAVSGVVKACAKNAFGSCSSTPTTTLTITGPTSVSPASASAGTSQKTITATIPSNAANGTYTATLSGGNTGSKTFSLGFAPATPSSFSANGSGARDVTFTWTKGSEPDLTGYTLADSNGTIIDSDITTSSANCASSSRCSYGLYYPSDNPGNHGYQLVAKRSGATSGSSVTSSPATANATLVLPPKPSPTPSPTPDATESPAPGTTTGGTTGGTTSGGSSTGGSTTGGSTTGGSSTGGSTTGGSTTGGSTTGTGTTGGTIPTGAKPTLPPSASNPVVASRRAFALNFNAFSPSLGIPKLPPLPATDLPSLSGEQPLPLGTFKPSLPYSPETETTKTRSLLSSPTAFVQTITDSAQLAKSIAGALILLLVGAHLRRYIGAHIEE